jgi:hypothetical protein
MKILEIKNAGIIYRINKFILLSTPFSASLTR